MQKKLEETTVILVSVIKWVFLATIIGILVGLSTTLFLKALSWGTLLTARFSYYYLLLPLVFIVTALSIKYLAPEAEGHGTEKVIEAVHKNSGKINALVVPVKLVTSVVTIAFGGSAGKEGPCAQIGAGISSLFSDIFKFNDSDKKKIVICGISAGFASVFGTPMAGAIFGVEVLLVGTVLYDVLLPSFISGLVSYHVLLALGIKYFYHPIKVIPVFSQYLLIKVIIAGISFGIVSFLMIETMTFFKNISSKIGNKLLKGLLGGLVLIVLTFIFTKQFLGLGIETIESVLEGGQVIWYAFFLKIIFTAITLNFGGSGGVLTPLFFIGSTSGAVLSVLLKIDSATLSAIGLVSVLSGATNTPIASSIMAIELFGPNVAPYAAISCIISFLITGHRSIYPSQILGIKKASSIFVEVGKEIGEIDKIKSDINLKETNVIDTIFRFFKKK